MPHLATHYIYSMQDVNTVIDNQHDSGPSSLSITALYFSSMAGVSTAANMAITVVSTSTSLTAAQDHLNRASLVVRGQVIADDVKLADRQCLLSETLREVDHLKLEVADLQARLVAMEEQMTQLWFSPNMPGYEMAKTDFIQTAQSATMQNLSCVHYARTDHNQ